MRTNALQMLMGHSKKTVPKFTPNSIIARRFKVNTSESAQLQSFGICELNHLMSRVTPPQNDWIQESELLEIKEAINCTWWYEDSITALEKKLNKKYKNKHISWPLQVIIKRAKIDQSIKKCDCDDKKEKILNQEIRDLEMILANAEDMKCFHTQISALISISYCNIMLAQNRKGDVFQQLAVRMAFDKLLQALKVLEIWKDLGDSCNAFRFAQAEVIVYTHIFLFFVFFCLFCCFVLFYFVVFWLYKQN